MASYANAVGVLLGHATLVVNHFHVVQLANRAVDDVRRLADRLAAATLDNSPARHDRRRARSEGCGDSLEGGKVWDAVRMTRRQL